MASTQPKVGTERELKLCAWPEFEVPDMAGALKGARAQPVVQTSLEATYYDTEDLALLRRGVTVCFRRGEAGGDVWTAKLPSEAAALGLARREISVAGSPGAMPRLLRDLTRGWAFGSPLKRVATIRTTRRTTSVLDEADKLVAVIDDDDVCGLRGGRVAARFRELEIELAPETPAKVLRTLAKALQGAGALPADQVPKLARTLGPGAGDASYLTAPQPVARPSVGDVLRTRLIDAAARLVDNHAAIALEEDPAAAVRFVAAGAAILADLRAFEPMLDPAAIAAIDGPLADVTGGVGTLRDNDAIAAALREDAARIDVGDGVDRVMAALAARHVRSRRRVMRMLRSASYAQVLVALRELALGPPLASASAKQRASTIVPTLAAPLARGLRGDIVRAADDGAPARLGADTDLLVHVLELARGFADKPAERTVNQARRAATACEQARLARVAVDDLAAVAKRTDTRTAWAAGVLAGMQIDRGAAAARDLKAAIRELDRKSIWAWMP